MMDLVLAPNEKIPAEFKELFEKGKSAVLKSYTIIYRDNSGEMCEAWHLLSELNMEYVKKKYKEQGKEIVQLVEKELKFGQYLKQLTEGK